MTIPFNAADLLDTEEAREEYLTAAVETGEEALIEHARRVLAEGRSGAKMPPNVDATLATIRPARKATTRSGPKLKRKGGQRELAAPADH